MRGGRLHGRQWGSSVTIVRLQTILLDADGPIIVVLRDTVDGAWLGMAVERAAAADEYLCVPISAARLSRFRHGAIDLRDVFVSPEESRFARVIIPASDLGQSVELVPILEIPEDWLPDAGFLLTSFIEPVAVEYRAMSDLATSENRPILRLNLSPEGGAHAVDVNELGSALILFQNGLRHAHSLVTKSLTFVQRRLQSAPENHTFEALAFASNSFEVHMRAKGGGDLFGNSPHVQALHKLDEIIAVVDDTDAAVTVAKANRGHFVSAVTALMKFVYQSDLPLSYAWTSPQSSRIHVHSVRPQAAKALYDALILKQELSQEEVTLTGVLKKLDVNNRAWTLLTPEGEEHHGFVTDGDVSISDLNVDRVVYRLQCRDILVETAGSGRQSTRLELLSRPIEITTGY